MKEQQHEVVIRGEIKAENVSNEILNVICKYIIKNAQEYYCDEKNRFKCESAEK